MANITYRILPVDLREDELFSAGTQLAEETTELQSIEDEKAASAKEFSDKIKATRSNMARLATMIETKQENRSVPCEIVMHSPVKGLKSIVRLDTGETVDEMDMTDRDKEAFQLSLQVPMFPSDKPAEDPKVWLQEKVRSGEITVLSKVG
jgi:hypothetical protein